MASTENRSLMRLTPESLVEMAYSSMRESILSGHFSEGEHIIESKVAEELGISRAPIREALRRLSQEGLTVERPRRGTFVREVSAKDFIDIYNVRIAVETAAVRLGVRRESSFEGVERAVQAMADAAKESDTGRTIDLELGIHQQICESSGNEYLAEVFHSLSGPIRIALGIDDASFEHLEDMVETHYPVLEAMRSGDGDRAVTAIQNHIIGTVGPVLERLGGDPGDLLARFSTSP